MFNNKKRNRQLSLLGVVAGLLILLSWFGFNTKSAKYDKPITAQNETIGEANISILLQRLAGSDKELNSLIDSLKTDSLNVAYIIRLKSAGEAKNIDVFKAYALYLKGIADNDNKLLQQSADLFFETGTHDQDSLADKTTYSVYAIRACDRILKTDSNNLAALTRKATAIVYFGGSVMTGVGLLKEVEKLDSNYIDAQHHLMILDLQSGQYKKAEKRVKKLLHLQPENQQYADILLKLETQQIK